MLRIILCIFLLIPTLSIASPTPEQKITHVIYITFDGTRWQDIFNTQFMFPNLRNKYAPQGKFYGEPGSNTLMRTDSIPVSLPSYQCQMAGRVTHCDSNDCGRIRELTLPENILYKLGLTKKDVATFSSWGSIQLAAESKEGVTFVNSGNIPMNDPILGYPDEVMEQINHEQAQNNPGEANDRYDQYTFAQAMHYYLKYQPTFMWISFNDADEAAHENKRAQYYQALGFYDYALDQVFKMLEDLHLNDQTLVLVTTDHGRGDGSRWTKHGPNYPESKQTWAFIVNGELVSEETTDNKLVFGTLSIRPTIEKALGIV